MNRAGSIAQPNVRSESYFIACSVVACERCSLATGVVCVGVTAGHQRLIDDEWITIGSAALLFQVEYLEAAVVPVLQELSPQFRIAAAGTGWGEYWLNHCQHCGAPQDDYWLHCEPGAAFLPADSIDTRRMDLVAVHEPFFATAVGFSELVGAIPPPEAMG